MAARKLELDAEVAAAPTKKVIVECSTVKLKLTLSEQLLQGTLEASLVSPFLGAFNKKAGGALKAEQLLGLTVDGGDTITDFSVAAGSVLVSEEPRVVLQPPPYADAGPIEALVNELLSLSADAHTERWKRALQTLRVAAKEEGRAKPPCLYQPKLLGIAAEHASLSVSAAARPWDGASSEAALLLLALLNQQRESVGTALLYTKDIDIAPALIGVLERCAELPLSRVRYVAQIGFHLSLLPAIAVHATRFASATRLSLGWASSCLGDCKSAEDEGIAAGIAADLARTAFNLLRASPPDLNAPSGRETAEGLLRAAASVIRAAGSSEELEVASRPTPSALPTPCTCSVHRCRSGAPCVRRRRRS